MAATEPTHSLLDDRDALRELHVRVQSYTEFLKLPFRDRVWRGRTGDFAGGGVGSSLDFQDHRNYIPGDDPRHINWQAYARTGNYTMKLYREEVRPMVDIIFDVSDSMFFNPEKARRSVELFYFSVEAAIGGGASLQCWLARGKEHRHLRDEAIHADAWPAEISNLQAGNPADPIALAGLRLRAGAMRILVSDLLFPGPPLETVAMLSSMNGRGILLAPFCDAEARPDWSGNYEFIDAESLTRHQHRVEPAVMKRYLAAYAKHFDLWKSTTQKHGVLFARIPSSPPLVQAFQLEAIHAGAVELMT